MESTACLLMTSNYHVNMIEIISILDKQNKFKSTLWKLLTTFVSLRGKKDFHTIYIHGNTVLNSQASITQNKYACLKYY